MLYTRKGDKGTSKLFNTPQGERLSKTNMVFEALGTVDELNSFLGLAKVKSQESGFVVGEKSFAEIVGMIQQDLFIIQAELAQSDMNILDQKVVFLEDMTNSIESTMPPITTFFVSGGTECGALFDTARAISRRAERAVLRALEENSDIIVSDSTRAYLNRLSSLLYALARLSNHLSGITEEPPKYS